MPAQSDCASASQSGVGHCRGAAIFRTERTLPFVTSTSTKTAKLSDTMVAGLPETTPLEKGVNHNGSAPGVGLVQEDELVLAAVEAPHP